MNNISALFENAVASLKMGIEDYELDRPERSLSAVRNFYAGLLLLAKEVLIRKAPNADPNEIIVARFKPVLDGAGGVDHVPDGNATIDFITIGKRLKDFGISIDPKAFEELNHIRNDIEHRYTSKPAHVVREAIARAFPVTLQLFRAANEDPRGLLGEAWPIMLGARELYEAELARCRATLVEIEWRSSTVEETGLQCIKCGSGLVEQRDPNNRDQELMILTCQGCGETLDWDDEIIDAIDRKLGNEAHYRAKDTGESGPVYVCPVCDKEAYVDFEEACALCGETIEWEANCMRCEAYIPLEDALDGFDEGLCSYCTYIMNKDD